MADAREASEDRDAKAADGGGAPREGSAEGVEDALRAANALRLARRWADAVAAYREVAERYAGTLSGYVATVAEAGIRLEHLGDGPGALAAYERAAREARGGALDAECLLGIARAHRLLGNGRAEIDALRVVIARHPGSPEAERARRRLFERDGGGR